MAEIFVWKREDKEIAKIVVVHEEHQIGFGCEKETIPDIHEKIYSLQGKDGCTIMQMPYFGGPGLLFLLHWEEEWQQSLQRFKITVSEWLPDTVIEQIE